MSPLTEATIMLILAVIFTNCFIVPYTIIRKWKTWAELDGSKFRWPRSLGGNAAILLYFSILILLNFPILYIMLKWDTENDRAEDACSDTEVMP